MRVLITGAAGFLGKECVKHFMENNHEVVATDKTGVVDLQGDLADPAFTVLLPDVDVVVNCSAVQYVSKDLPFFFRAKFFKTNNILPAKNLSERYKNSQTHFIHVGTSMMYKQTGQDLYSINSPMYAEGVYSKSKLQAQAFIEKMQSSATIVPCIIGGKGREGLFRGFVTLMKKFGVVIFPGQGKHKAHMVHVVDVACLILRVATVRATGVYNAAAPGPLSIRQWVDEIKEELGMKRVILLPIPLLPVKWLSRLFLYRILAREQLLMLELPHVLDTQESLAIGWNPKFSNAQIVRDIAVYINNEESV